MKTNIFKLSIKSFLYSSFICGIIITFIYFDEQKSCNTSNQVCGVGFMISGAFGIIIVGTITFISFLVSLYNYYSKKNIK